MEGETVGSYLVTRLLGKGGMGAVYLAEHALLKRPAALKVLLPALSADEELVDRFFDEARATTSIPDPGIVQIFDFGYHTDGSAYIVMEYLEGETLDVRIEGDGPLAPVSALRIARQVATSLEAAHTRGVIHRDLKLENVFLVNDAAVPGGERAKILDFGIAKLARDDGSRSRTRTGAIMGTPIYMSPEQCKGAHDVDARSDVYSLGCMLFCMVTGRPPFDYESAGEIIAAHLREDPPALADADPELATRWPGGADWLDELGAIIDRCLVKDPAARFQSMAEVAAAITEALGDDDADAPRTTMPRAARRASSLGDAAAPLATPVPPGSLARPTTLSSATGATHPPSASPAGEAPSRRRWVLPAVTAAAVAVAAVVAIAVIASGGSGAHPSAPAGSQPADPSPSPPSPPTAPLEPTADVPLAAPEVAAPGSAAPSASDPTEPVVDEALAVEPPVTEPQRRPAKKVRPRPPSKRPSAPSVTTKPTPAKGSHDTKPANPGGAGNVDRGD